MCSSFCWSKSQKIRATSVKLICLLNAFDSYHNILNYQRTLMLLVVTCLLRFFSYSYILCAIPKCLYVSIHFKCPHRFNSKGDQFAFCHLSLSSFYLFFYLFLSLMLHFLLSSAQNSQCSECLTSRFDHVQCACLCHRYATTKMPT